MESNSTGEGSRALTKWSKKRAGKRRAKTLVPCVLCGEEYPLEELQELTEEDTQGYHSPGWYCQNCARAVRYEAFQVEDEDASI